MSGTVLLFYDWLSNTYRLKGAFISSMTGYGIFKGTAIIQKGCLLHLQYGHTVFYPNLKSLLRSIKDIGAHNVGEDGRQGMLGRAAWRRIEAAYEQFRTPAGLPASYDVLLGYASK